jgi:catechol 2,3-dioxygenase-like lactoylglutathione lyase family enzyme
MARRNEGWHADEVGIALNHTIVWSRDARASAEWLAELLGLPPPTKYGPFDVVELSNGVSLDFIDHEGEIPFQHYAFLVSEDEFDRIHGRIVERGITFYADPGASKPGEINTHDGGRGVYWADPDGHWLEIITVPYGGW